MQPCPRSVSTASTATESVPATRARVRRAILGALFVIVSCLVAGEVLFACSSSSGTHRGGPGQHAEAQPRTPAIVLTREQKESAWRDAESTPWTSPIFARATDRAGFVPISTGQDLHGIAVTIFFDGPVSLPAGLPMLAGGAERGNSQQASQAITTETNALVASAVIVFVIDGSARWMTTIPEPLLSDARANESEEWTQRTRS